MGRFTNEVTMDQPIRIKFNTETKFFTAFFDTEGRAKVVNGPCDADNFAAADAQLGPGEECVIDDSTDLIIWTRHLSSFVTYSQPPTSSAFSDATPPSFSTRFTESENPLVIGNTIFSELGNYNVKTGETMIFKTKSQIPIKLLLFENRGGPDNIVHVALYTNLYGTTTELHQSDTWISYDKGEPLTVYDPNGFFEDVTFEIKNVDNQKLEITFFITFAKPMQQSDIIIRAWDSVRNSVTATIIDAWEITGIESIAPPAIIDEIESIATKLEEEAKIVEKAATEAPQEEVKILQEQADELIEIAQEFVEQSNQVQTEIETIQAQIEEALVLVSGVEEEGELVQKEFDAIQKVADGFQKQADAARTIAAAEETPQQVIENLLAQAVNLQEQADKYQKEADSVAIKRESYKQQVSYYQAQVDTLSDQIDKLDIKLEIIQTEAEETLSDKTQQALSKQRWYQSN